MAKAKNYTKRNKKPDAMTPGERKQRTSVLEGMKSRAQKLLDAGKGNVGHEKLIRQAVSEIQAIKKFENLLERQEKRAAKKPKKPKSPEQIAYEKKKREEKRLSKLYGQTKGLCSLSPHEDLIEKVQVVLQHNESVKNEFGIYPQLEHGELANKLSYLSDRVIQLKREQDKILEAMKKKCMALDSDISSLIEEVNELAEASNRRASRPRTDFDYQAVGYDSVFWHNEDYKIVER